MDDMDSVQAQIARNMLQSGDWVTPRLDGVAYLEKSPLKYWMIATSFAIFGVHDWAARIPIALSAVLLCWVTARFGAWAFGRTAGMYAGISLATCVGLFLFTRVLIPDVVLTLAVTVALWGLLRATDEAEEHPARWAMAMWAAIGTGLLLKGMIAAVFPVAAGMLYLGLTRQLLVRKTWTHVLPGRGILLLLLIAAPWHVLATLRNPPYLDFTMHSERGSYHGFFWFYFINEQILRFLNLRYPRDYNTVPRWLFWAFHLLWLFPWSAYLPAVFRLDYRKPDRASRTRLMALCWCGFILAFFTLSTTQEYYSMPCYPALALLLGSAMDKDGVWLKRGTKALGGIASLCVVAIAAILWMVARRSDGGRYFGSAESAESRCLYAVTGAYGRSDAGRIRVPSLATGDCGDSIRGWGGRRMAEPWARPGMGFGGDDGVVLSRGALGAGNVRSVLIVAAVGAGAARFAGG